MKLKILLLSDGIPGHYRQAEAMVAALARRRAVAVERVEVRLRAGVPKRLASRLARMLPPRLALRWLYGIKADKLSKPALILSAGGLTLGANAALAAHFRVPNVFAGSARGFGPERIALTLLPYASAATLPGHAFALKPAAIDPDALPHAPVWNGPSEGQTFALLIGGPTRAAAFDAQDWQDLAILVETLLKQWGIGWQIFTSRRTPEEVYARLQPLAEAYPERVKIMDFRQAGAGSITEAFTHPVVFVTADSLSMLTEAVAARRPVLALLPRATTPSRDDEAVASLAAQKRLVLLPLHDATPAICDELLHKLQPMGENHLDVLVDLIVHRIKI